jgi:hypothetical protein
MDFFRKYKGKLMLLFVALAWGSTMVVIKGATDFIPPGFLLACRFTLASAALLFINRKKLNLLDKDYIKSGIIIGICRDLKEEIQIISIVKVIDIERSVRALVAVRAFNETYLGVARVHRSVYRRSCIHGYSGFRAEFIGCLKNSVVSRARIVRRYRKHEAREQHY